MPRFLRPAEIGGVNMKIQLNGELRDTGLATSVLELLQSLDLPLVTLLVEHNGLALRRDEWSQYLLQEGDRLEVIRIVAGG